ncbi:MAG: hypothetical protein M3451_00900 [Chloroflexota bacterium]|nr:hypothetical protein [Chloroflexota bacterium]
MNQSHRSSYRHALSRRGVLTLAAALALRSPFVMAGQTDVADDLPPFADRIGMLLAMAPARELTDDPLISFYHADLARQMASVGVELPDSNAAPDSLPDGFVESSLALPLAARAFQAGMTPEWFETFGFNPFGVDQALALNDPPDILTIFTGDFDVDQIESVLDASGYRRFEQEIGGSYWTVGDELDLGSQVGQLGFGTMNHAAVYKDVLVFAQREADVQELTHVVAGNVAPMLEQERWAGMIALFSPDTVGLIPVSPEIAGAGDGSAVVGASTLVPGTSSGLEYMAFGVRAGSVSEPLSLVGQGTPEAAPVSGSSSVPAQVEVRIRYADAAMSGREAEAIPERWRELSSPLTGQPYAELMRLDNSRAHEDDDSVVAVDFVSDVPNRWIQMVQTRDLAPFLPVVG